MITVVVVLLLGIGGTCVGVAWKNKNTVEIEKDVDEKTADNKKENEKVQDDVLSDSKVDAVEASVQNDNVVSENKTDSDANVHTGNASVTNTSSGNCTGNNSSASSSNNAGNNTGNSTGNSSTAPSGNSANNNSSNNNSNSNSNSTTEQPTHTHTWVHVDATGHEETEIIQDACDEEVPVYENVAHDICNVCGEDLTDFTEENASAHSKAHALAYEGSGWHTEWRYEQTGTQIVHHDAVTEQHWVEDEPAYDVCSTCGARK